MVTPEGRPGSICAIRALTAPMRGAAVTRVRAAATAAPLASGRRGREWGRAVRAGAGAHDAADGLVGALHERRRPERVPELDVGDLVEEHRHAPRFADDDLLHVVDGRDQPDAADDQPGAVRLEDVAADVDV